MIWYRWVQMLHSPFLDLAHASDIFTFLIFSYILTAMIHSPIRWEWSVPWFRHKLLINDLYFKTQSHDFTPVWLEMDDVSFLRSSSDNFILKPSKINWWSSLSVDGNQLIWEYWYWYSRSLSKARGDNVSTKSDGMYGFAWWSILSI